MFDETTIAAVSAIARREGWDPAGLLAVVEVESAGKAFAVVDGRQEPLIRFEGHYFDKRLSGAAKTRARAAGLASPKAGAVGNPSSQAARWKLLARAIEINAQAAYESVSWGVGQVMGSHWSWLGFGAVTDLVNLCRRDVAGQVELMVRFVKKSGLSAALARRDWAAFAHGYNGPAYAKNKYDTKMAQAHARWAKRLPSAPAPSASEPKRATPPRLVLRRGDRGDTVLQLQRLLAARGAALVADAEFGPRTERAVKTFQESRGLAADGIVGPRTWTALES
jgi:hypothetical protein